MLKQAIDRALVAGRNTELHVAANTVRREQVCGRHKSQADKCTSGTTNPVRRTAEGTAAVTKQAAQRFRMRTVENGVLEMDL